MSAEVRLAGVGVALRSGQHAMRVSVGPGVVVPSKYLLLPGRVGVVKAQVAADFVVIVPQ